MPALNNIGSIVYPTAHGCPVTATASVVAVFYFCQVGALFQGPQWSALNFLDLDVDYFKPGCTSRAQVFPAKATVEDYRSLRPYIPSFFFSPATSFWYM